MKYVVIGDLEYILLNKILVLNMHLNKFKSPDEVMIEILFDFIKDNNIYIVELDKVLDS